jgi:hypothetical protein
MERFGRGAPRRFRPDEIADELEPGEEPELLATARDLEWLAAVDNVGPSWDFNDRVMASIQAEPLPRPVVAAYGAARRGRPFAALAALGDLWRVAFGGGRPLSVRLPAMALVGLLFVAVAGAGAVGAGALSGMLSAPAVASPAPTPLTTQLPPNETPALTPSPPQTSESSPSPEPSDESSPMPSATSSDRPDSSAEDATPDPGESEGVESESGSLATDAPTSGQTARPVTRATNRPVATSTDTPKPHETHHSNETPTPRPTETPHGGGGDGGGGANQDGSAPSTSTP